MAITDPAAFILANTRFQAVPHAPEISLWLADEITPIWRMTEEELGELGLPPPFWAFAWAGGQAVARWLLDNPAEVAGKTVLDFATGSGLVGIAAMKAGAASVLAVDIDPHAVVATQLNARANDVTVESLCADLLDGPPPAVEVVLAGDVFYSRALARRTLPFLRRCRDVGLSVLIGDPGRATLPRSRLTQVAAIDVPDFGSPTPRPAGVYRLRGPVLS